MRKPLIAALGLVSLISLADMASATDPSYPHPTDSFDHDTLKAGCTNSGGTFDESKVSGSYWCKGATGDTIACNKSGACQSWIGLTRGNSKAGASTTAGGLGNAQFPGGTTGPGASSGGTAPGRSATPAGTLNGSANGPVVRDHRPGGNASNAPPRAAPTAGKVTTPAVGTAPARAPTATAVGTLNGSPTGPVVRDHRPGGNASHVAPRSAAAGGAAGGQKKSVLQ
jgi:hypothetical protein